MIGDIIRNNNKNISNKVSYNDIISCIDSLFFNEITFNKTIKFNRFPMLFDAITDYIDLYYRKGFIDSKEAEYLRNKVNNFFQLAYIKKGGIYNAYCN